MMSSRLNLRIKINKAIHRARCCLFPSKSLVNDFPMVSGSLPNHRYLLGRFRSGLVQPACIPLH